MNRVEWPSYFLNIARAVSERATCDRKKVGAIIVRDKLILATGYNGSPRGWAQCDVHGHEMKNIGGRESCIRTIHAEENAVIQCARYGIKMEGAVVYCTASPCYDCFKMLANAGITSVYYGEEYVSARSSGNDISALAERYGITFHHIS
jgi:dCMP deaminase